MALDLEPWTEAFNIARVLGDFAPIWIAERIMTLGLSGDDATVQRFKILAARLDELLLAEMPGS